MEVKTVQEYLQLFYNTVNELTQNGINYITFVEHYDTGANEANAITDEQRAYLIELNYNIKLRLQGLKYQWTALFSLLKANNILRKQHEKSDTQKGIEDELLEGIKEVLKDVMCDPVKLDTVTQKLNAFVVLYLGEIK